ncbi:unnamed protein product [Caenorhabditis angaria]|uniref:Uncharacterized protein n=1 Tax=Caenorhabditis angaria TaxID=860376 RepID=A0A9P1J169_9PELO|nr:unnamed protein product [Caenorhabditis angaria]
MTRQNIRPCRVTVNDSCSNSSQGGWFRSRFVLIRPRCCLLDTFTLLYILAIIGLIFSIVSLILVSIYTPNPLEIIVFSFAIIAMAVVIGTLITKNLYLAQISFCLLIVLIILLSGAVFYLFFSMMLSQKYHYGDWRFKVFMITEIIFIICVAIYVSVMLYLLLDVITYCKRNREEVETPRNTIHFDNRY